MQVDMTTDIVPLQNIDIADIIADGNSEMSRIISPQLHIYT